MKRTLALLLALVMLFALCACGSNDAAESKDPEDVKTITDEDGKISGDAIQENLDAAEERMEENNVMELAELIADAGRTSTANTDKRYPAVTITQSTMPNSLNVLGQGCLDAACETINYMCFERLMYRVDANEYRGRLAKSWEWNEDETELSIELYDNIYDWNGKKITSSDVAYSFDTYAASGHATNFSYYDHIEVVDDTHCVLVLNAPIADTLSFASMMNTLIVSQASSEGTQMDTKPVGTGPYVIKEFVTDAYIVMEANDNYWDIESPDEWAKANVQEYRIDFIADANQQLLALQSGSAMNLTSVNSTDLPTLLPGGEYGDQFNIFARYNIDTFGLVANCYEGKPTSDINLRMAIWYACNTEDFVDANGADVYAPCTVFTSRAIADYDESWNSYDSYMTTYNLELAREYLAKSSYKGEELIIMTKQFPPAMNVNAQVLAASLQAIGINAKVEQYEHAVCMDYLCDPNRFDIWMYSGRDTYYCINAMSNWLSTAYGKMEGYTLGYVKDAKLQELVDIASSKEGIKDSANTKAVIDYAVEQGYIYGVCYALEYSAYSKDIAQFTLDAAGVPLIFCSDYYLD